MKKYYMLLSSLLFTACMDTAEPVVLDKEYERYGAIQKSCFKIINDEKPHCEEKHCEILPQECKEFIEVLGGANLALQNMKKNKNNAAFYTAKEKYKKEKNRLKIKHRHLNLMLKAHALDAIDSNDLDEFTKIINFSYHPMNMSYYNYMKKHMPHFENTKKYFHFEKKFALKKYKEGYALVNKGKYTKGLASLELAAKMKNIKAARLCGDVLVDIYPSKAKSCYLQGVELGNKHMLLSLALEYEKDNDTNAAYEWFEKSALAGNYIAQYKLYDLNKNENQKWLIKSADSGYDIAQYTYGMRLSDNRQYDLAQKYLLKASKQGYNKANYPLGKLYFSQKKYKQAYTYLSKGSDNADSMYKLGYLKEYGKGTSKNYYAAGNYYEKAKKLGKKEAYRDIDRVKKAKRRLQKSQIRKQKVLAEASYEQINAKARLREEVRKEDERMNAIRMASKADAQRLKAQACGVEPSSSSLKRNGARIHLQGTLTHWLGKTSFIINAGGKEYLVKDEDDEGRLNKGDSVNMVAISTGKREITHGLKRSLFDEADETAIEKAYALDYEGECPY